MATVIALANRALACIAAGAITDLGEGSLESIEVSRWLPSLIDEVPTWADWIWLVKRAALVGMVNDRPAEWAAAWAPPGDMQEPLAVRDSVMDAQVAQTNHWPVAGLASFPRQEEFTIPMLYESGMIYTNAAQPVLIYQGSQADPADYPPLLARAFELELASRIALPLKKDANLANALANQAETARQRAVADNENQRKTPKPWRENSVDMARAGWADI
jgi:hypothetical protein